MGFSVANDRLPSEQIIDFYPLRVLVSGVLALTQSSENPFLGCHDDVWMMAKSTTGLQPFTMFGWRFC